MAPAMPDPVMTSAERPWRDGLSAGVGAALIVGLIVAVIDSAIAGFGAFPALLAMWAPPALALGVTTGLVVAGFRATFGDGALRAGIRRLREDRELDVAVTGAMIASLFVAGLIVIGVGAAAKGLVIGRERVQTGLRLLGVAVVVMVPLIALLGFPIFRVTRRIAAMLPGKPSAVWIVVVGGVGAVALGLFVVFTQLEWRVLGLEGYALFGGLILGTWLLVGLSRGPLDAVRRVIPARGVIAAAGALIAVVLPLAILRGAPSREVQSAVTDKAIGGSRLLRIYRGLIDADGDGRSPFFGGPDCDDGDPNRYFGKPDLPTNDLDEDCDGTPYKAPVKPVEDHPTDGGVVTPPTPSNALAPGANVLILMVDTVRADRLGIAGYKRDDTILTPRIDALAAQGVWFTHAYSVASNTPRAMPAFVTSRYPSVVKVNKLFDNYPKMDDANVTVFEQFKEAGLATYGFSSHYYFKEERGFGQGFDAYDNEGWLKPADANTDSAAPRIVPRVTAKLTELAASKQRFAMWVHLFEPHGRYIEHEGFPTAGSKGLRGTESHKHNYDYEIAYTDTMLGQILDTLDQTKLTENTIVVFVSDHGEAFAVHRVAGEGMMFHGQTLYDELLHIPLIIRGPGIKPGKVDSVVSLIDVAPTLLDAIGATPPPTFMGRSLVPGLRGEPLASKPAFAELIPYPNWDHEWRAVIAADAQWKLIHRVSDNSKEMYDLVADIEERKDVYEKGSEKEQELDALLQEFVNVTLPTAAQQLP